MKDLRRSDKIVLALILLSLVLVLGSTAWKNLYKKSYYFTVEDTCNPKTEMCFHRDCSVDGTCPPNGLSDYKVFKVRAGDFPRCLYNSCAVKCESGAISCTQVKCGASNEDSCSSSPEPAAQ